MPNITVYISKDLFENLKSRPDINKSQVVADALKKAVKKEKKS